MSRSAARARQDTGPRSHASARLGLLLRSVLLAPRDGFASSIKAAERRARAEIRPAEGLSPFVLAAVGGAALSALWLKVGALVGLREVCSDRYIGLLIAGALVAGAILALLAQALWGFVGARAVDAMQGAVSRRDLRLVWGASALPQVFVLVLLLPLDLLVVGTDTFTTSSLDDSVSTGWAAFSIALGISAAIWSLFLFVRGVEVAGGLSLKRALVGTVVAIACLGAVVAVAGTAASLTSGGDACPTRLG